MSLEKRSNLIKEFGETDIEKMLDKLEEEIENPKTTIYTHEEVFSKARRIANI